jgi:hypothetical protein
MADRRYEYEELEEMYPTYHGMPFRMSQQNVENCSVCVVR